MALWRVREKLEEISAYLEPGDRVLDIGAGNCILCRELGRLGYNVIPLDCKDHSFVDEIEPVVYDGTTLPFGDDSFDLALIITVLHHSRDPESILAQASRVAKRIIVIEEVYQTRFEKYFTYTIDSLFNLEFFNHPRSNRTDLEWRATFRRLRLNVSGASCSRSLGFLRRVTYVLVRAHREKTSL